MIDGAPVNVKDFGAVGDGVANDTQAIQAAIDFCVYSQDVRVLHFPAGDYLTDALIVRDRTGKNSDAPTPVRFQGMATNNAANPASKLVFTTTSPGTVGITQHMPNCSYDDLAFESTNAANMDRFILMESYSGTVTDVDTSVTNCRFFRAYIAVSCEGRGLHFTRNQVITCNRVVVFSFPDPYTGTGPNDNTKAWRSNRVNDNRMHTECEYLVYVESNNREWFQALQCHDNYLDGPACKVFFGGGRHLSFQGTVSTNNNSSSVAYSDHALFEFRGAVNLAIITGNVFGDSNQQGNGGSIINAQNCRVSNLTVSNNTFSRYILDSFNFVDSNASDIIITDNQFFNCAIFNASRYRAGNCEFMVMDNSDLFRLTFSGNVIHSPNQLGGTRAYLIQSINGGDIGNIDALANRRDVSLYTNVHNFGRGSLSQTRHRTFSYVGDGTPNRVLLTYGQPACVLLSKIEASATQPAIMAVNADTASGNLGAFYINQVNQIIIRDAANYNTNGEEYIVTCIF